MLVGGITFLCCVMSRLLCLHTIVDWPFVDVDGIIHHVHVVTYSIGSQLPQPALCSKRQPCTIQPPLQILVYIKNVVLDHKCRVQLVHNHVCFNLNMNRLLVLCWSTGLALNLPYCSNNTTTLGAL